MHKAVFDSSVLVSAFLKPDGTPGKLLHRAREKAFLLSLSRPLVYETVTVLMRPKNRERHSYIPQKVERFVRLLLLLAQPLEQVLPQLNAVPGDPKDDMVVATAVAARADYLVTGDQAHLLPLSEYQGIAIVTPREFLTRLDEERGV